VDGARIAAIGKGILVLLGIGRRDGASDMAYIADKCVGLRIFEDDAGVNNLSLEDIGGELLLVSQFTLYGDARKGRRPGYFQAAPPDVARGLFEECVHVFRRRYDRVETGRFQAMMDVAPVCCGPVTILLDSKKEF
jgi:D-tyrosyl-tRNA(Tyr) deacylase